MQIKQGDVVAVLRRQKADSFDACLTDPPYGLSFMGKAWDRGVPSAEVWREVFRVLKPGAPILAFGGTRTYHRLACAIEDAGFEIRDCLSWLYGSGFPKSHDLSKAIDRLAGAERERIPATGSLHKNRNLNDDGWSKIGRSDATQWSNIATTPDAKRWNGYGTALKPAWEPIILAMKPAAGTFAENALAYGVGGLNNDGCRIESDGSHKRRFQPTNNARLVFGAQRGFEPTNASGRWPANVLFDEAAAELLDRQSGYLKSGGCKSVDGSFGSGNSWILAARGERVDKTKGDSGGASRFFYVAKASQRERGENNTHPTVKPVALAEYLARLILPPAGRKRRLLVPFSGSGSELLGARRAGWEYALGIEISEEYREIAERRLAA